MKETQRERVQRLFVCFLLRRERERVCARVGACVMFYVCVCM